MQCIWKTNMHAANAMAGIYIGTRKAFQRK